jgi:hypothetical protein
LPFALASNRAASLTSFDHEQCRLVSNASDREHHLLDCPPPHQNLLI